VELVLYSTGAQTLVSVLVCRSKMPAWQKEQIYRRPFWRGSWQTVQPWIRTKIQVISERCV